ncbi:hypothetical protein ACWDRX_02400, partial [Streptomyces nigra]
KGFLRRDPHRPRAYEVRGSDQAASVQATDTAAVVAAHNNALRSWLRSDGRGDAGAEVDRALAYVQSTYAEAPEPPRAAAAEADGDVVVVVSRRDAPLWRVVKELETVLGHG